MQSHLQVNLAILVLQLLINSQLKYNRKTSTLSGLKNVRRDAALSPVSRAWKMISYPMTMTYVTQIWWSGYGPCKRFA